MGCLIYCCFGYWFSGSYVGTFRALAHDWELQPSELGGVLEKCPTSSLQEVLGEPMSQAVRGTSLPIARHRGSLGGYNMADALGRHRAPEAATGHPLFQGQQLVMEGSCLYLLYRPDPDLKELCPSRGEAKFLLCPQLGSLHLGTAVWLRSCVGRSAASLLAYVLGNCWPCCL